MSSLYQEASPGACQFQDARTSNRYFFLCVLMLMSNTAIGCGI